MRGMRRVGLALIYKRGVSVGSIAVTIGTSHDGAACYNHEPQIGG